jgi:hypothetical protein
MCDETQKRECQVSYRIVLIAALFSVLLGGACLAVGPFSGSWNVEIGITPQQTMAFSSFSSTLDVSFCVGFLELSSSSDFIYSGWLWQELGLSAHIGLVGFDGLALFEPQTGSFLYAQGILEFNLYPITMRLYAAMIGPDVSGGPNHGCVFDIYGELLGGLAWFESATFLGADLSGITFTQTASAASSNLLTKTYLTDPTIDIAAVRFSGEEFTFSACFCRNIQLTSITTFSQTGFESEEIELTLSSPFFGFPFSITLDYVFTLQTSSHTFTPSLETEYGCVKIYTTLSGSGGVISGLEVYGIAFEAAFEGATFTSISNLNSVDYVITTPAYGLVVEPLVTALAEGHLYYPQEYWEIVSLVVETPMPGCGVTFEVDTFFSAATGLLFDWAKSEMGVTVAFGDFFSVSSGIVVDLNGFTEWTLSLAVAW